MMLAAAAFNQKRAGLPIAAVTTLGTLVVLGLGYRTGQAGGSLVYEYGAAQAYTTSGTGDARTAPAPRGDDD
jgi:hypothetical protein